jgi:quinol-cytochrome oxidoreductase complex cytochrome b subunit
MLVPFINRTPGHGMRKRIFNVIGIFIVLFIVVMTIVGFLS